MNAGLRAAQQLVAAKATTSAPARRLSCGMGSWLRPNWLVSMSAPTANVVENSDFAARIVARAHAPTRQTGDVDLFDKPDHLKV